MMGIVIGGSAGGMEALSIVLGALSPDLSAVIMAVLHLSADSSGILPSILASRCALPVKEADDKEMPDRGHVYIAPADYHLLVERDLSLTLTVEEPVWYARPSIDVLFETAAEAYGRNLVAVLLTGANKDGTDGMSAVRRMGGINIVQEPTTADVATMPRSAIEGGWADHILPLRQIGSFLNQLVTSNPGNN